MGLVGGVEFSKRPKELILNGSVFIMPRAGALCSEIESWKAVSNIQWLSLSSWQTSVSEDFEIDESYWKWCYVKMCKEFNAIHYCSRIRRWHSLNDQKFISLPFYWKHKFFLCIVGIHISLKWKRNILDLKNYYVIYVVCGFVVFSV